MSPENHENVLILFPSRIMTRGEFGGIRGDLDQTGEGPLRRYRSIVLGRGSLWSLFSYELVTTLVGSLGGKAGARLRRFFYPFFLGPTGRKIIIGESVSFRHPRKIRIGERSIIGDGATLDARGEGASISLGRRVSIGTETVLNCRGGSLEMEDNVDIGDRCRLGSLEGLFIGGNSVIGREVCLSGAGHSAERTDTPIIRQPVTCKGPIRIGRDVTIGEGSTILDGVSVGARCRIEPGSLVNRDVPDGTTVGGVPASVRGGGQGEGG